MRTVVALLEARPETILDDYARLFALAGMRPGGETPPRIAAAAGRGVWQPGLVAPPWQLAGTLAGAPPGGLVLPVAGAGGGAAPTPAEWEPVLRASGARAATEGAWSPRRQRPATPTPALDAVLSGDPHLPAGLLTGDVFLLAVPEVGRGWPVAGAVELLTRLVLPAGARVRRRPLDEIVAETVAVARESVNLCGAVLDGTVWHVHEGNLARWPVGRNVILAGPDPVAVDAVATRLAGADPRRVPWLRRCAERGVGEIRPERIRIVGQTQLLERDFALPAPALVATTRLQRRRRWAELAYDVLKRRGVERSQRGTPWGRLCHDFRTGREVTP